MTAQPTISAVVLSYNRPDHLREALTSIYGQGCTDLEVIVVDNRSPSSEKVLDVVQGFPGVKFLPQASNLGFAAGMNTGLRASKGRYVHLTEDDIVLDKGFYERLLSCAQPRPADLFSGVLYEQPGERCLFAGATLEIGRRYVQEGLPEPKFGSVEPYQVGMLIGAMMFGGREAFEAVSGFREEFFLYFEDAELCWRFRKGGGCLWIVPSVKAWHTAPLTAGFRPLIEFHKLKNYLALNLLYMPALPVLWVLMKFFTYTTVRKAIEGQDFGLLVMTWGWAMVHLWGYLWERCTRIE